MYWFLHISQPITAMGKRDFKCQTPIQNNMQVSSSCIVTISKSEKNSNIRWGYTGGVGWHTVNPTVLCKAAQYQSSVRCPKTTVRFLDILLHSIRKLLLWGKFGGALLFLKELLHTEEIKSI